jgi:hypothetical protein
LSELLSPLSEIPIIGINNLQSQPCTLSCLVYGTDSVTLPKDMSVRKGTWTILYQLNPLVQRYLTFQLPVEGEAQANSLEDELIKKRNPKSVGKKWTNFGGTQIKP